MQPEPIEINCREHKDVTVKVFPRMAGRCQVKLIITASTIDFENGAKEMIGEVEAAAPEDKLELVFHVKMICQIPSVLHIVLRAVAINPDGSESFTARAGARVDGRTEVPNNEAA